MKVDVNISGIDGVLATLRSLPPEVVSNKGGVVKLALAKGARLIRDAAKANLAAQIAKNGDESTGLLMQNLVASRGKAPNERKGERYLVRVRRKSYSLTDKKPVTTVKVAHLLEYGSEHQPATPFIRPAFQSKASEAIDVINKDLIKRIDNVVKKLAKQNAGKK